MLLIPVVHVVLVKCYKLRERERHKHPCNSGEHYERYFDQEKEYMSDNAVVRRESGQCLDVT